MSAEDAGTPLFEVTPAKGRKSTGGPVYQGVNAQVAALFPDHTKDAEVGARYAAAAGIVASARSLAASIDRVSGHGGSRQASGHQLALMHGQLAELLDRLEPDDAAAVDPFAVLLEQLNATPPRANASDPATPHPA